MGSVVLLCSPQPTSQQTYINTDLTCAVSSPMSAGDLSHLRAAGGGGGADNHPPDSKAKKCSSRPGRQCRQRSIGRGKFCKKIIRSFFDQVKFEVTVGQKRKIFLKIGLFSENATIISITITASRIVR